MFAHTHKHTHMQSVCMRNILILPFTTCRVCECTGGARRLVENWIARYANVCMQMPSQVLKYLYMCTCVFHKHFGYSFHQKPQQCVRITTLALVMPKDW